MQLNSLLFVHFVKILSLIHVNLLFVYFYMLILMFDKGAHFITCVNVKML